MPEDPRLSNAQMLIMAARGVGQIDAQGPRGITLVNALEIEAMACALVAFGLIAIPPGGETPEYLIIQPTKEAADAI